MALELRMLDREKLFRRLGELLSREYCFVENKQEAHLGKSVVFRGKHIILVDPIGNESIVGTEMHNLYRRKEAVGRVMGGICGLGSGECLPCSEDNDEEESLGYLLVQQRTRGPVSEVHQEYECMHLSITEPIVLRDRRILPASSTKVAASRFSNSNPYRVKVDYYSHVRRFFDLVGWKRTDLSHFFPLEGFLRDDVRMPR